MVCRVPLTRCLRGQPTLDVEHGDPAGAPVIALHGVTDCWCLFEPLLPHLPRTLRRDRGWTHAVPRSRPETETRRQR